MLRLFNTLSRKVEEFKSINPPQVGMYGCGPTVYDHIHIGNGRSFIMYDILRRTLQIDGFEVTFIQNITDIEDKIIKRSKEMNLTPQELTEKYTKIFFEDTEKLNILPANNYPKATEHINEMIKYIEELIKKGLAYKEPDGSVYFDVSEFEDYGKLSGVDKSQIKTGTRVLSDEYEKEDVQDFALWKGIETAEFGWDSPWGKGRPGWHIECSVMSQEYLGETFDIHAGGVDLMFPHHENEIAQAEGKTGQKFVNFWVHGEHLLIDNSKMSKSKNNFYTLVDIEERGFEPLAYRYLVLTAHYRDKLNFTWESLESAQNALNNLREIVRGWDKVESQESGVRSQEYWDKFLAALNNDLNTSQALVVMWELVKSDLPSGDKAATLTKMDLVLGLGLEEYIGKQIEVPQEVQKLVDQREQARIDKDFSRSDQLRDEIKKLGYEVLDTPQGPKIKR